jgi:hypothetical protein
MRAPRAAAALALAAAVALVPGCGWRATRTWQWLGLSPTYQTGITEDELASELDAYGQRFAIGVTAAADAVSAAATERETRRRSLLWKMRMVPAVGIASSEKDAQAEYVALLTLAIAQRKYLTEGEGAALFGAQQPIAVAEAKRLEEDCLGLGLRFLTESAREGVRWQVEDLTWRYPLRNVFLAETTARGYAAEQTVGTFDWVFAIPLSPFRALEGVDTGAQAIREFNGTARDFSDKVARLPELVRWESELLLYNAEDRDTVAGSLAALETVAASAERLSLAAERLPADLRSEIEATMREIEARQEGLQKTLAEARAGLVDLGASLEKASALSEGLARLAEQADRAGATWQGVATTLRGPEDARDPNARPFDITEYERVAARVESASHAVREMAAELRAGGDAFRGLLDATFVRLALLLLAFFALRFGFGLLARRFERGRGER